MFSATMHGPLSLDRKREVFSLGTSTLNDKDEEAAIPADVMFDEPTSPTRCVTRSGLSRDRAHNRPMNKRHFLGTAALAGLLPGIPASAAEPARKGPGLLTISGAIG